MTDMIAPGTIVTGGLRGLGRAMALGLLEQGHRVTAVGHLHEDVAEMQVQAGAKADRLLPLVADLRKPAECDRVFAESRRHFSSDPLILVNNAGLTFTFIDGAPCSAFDAAGGVGPPGERHHQAGHHEPGRQFALWPLEGSARDGYGNLGQGT
jgi:NAD(P)-dependent dehydrogenase (short-subunit alcohol dehydrogenase family)